MLVHDAARPCLESADVAALIAALEAGASGAVLAAPVVDTVKRERDGTVCETVDRSGLWRALTPQAFALGELERALEEAARANVSVTDESQAMERQGVRPVLVQGSPFNMKVTRAADLPVAARILQSAENRTMSGKVRIGQGFDVHTFGDGDHVLLGGVRIAHDRGVIAHSDGDVVIHALCDAVLGALGKGDIGRHFPDTDPRYRGADSRLFLRTVAAMMREAGYRLVNADVTVLAEAPRIAAHRDAMAANLAEDLDAAPELINIKATTTERMGFVGRGEGLAAQAAVLLEGSVSIRGRRAEAWTRAALSPPRAHGAPLSAVRIKAEPEDFRVEEELSFVPSGEGPAPVVARGEALGQYPLGGGRARTPRRGTGRGSGLRGAQGPARGRRAMVQPARGSRVRRILEYGAQGRVPCARGRSSIRAS